MGLGRAWFWSWVLFAICSLLFLTGRRGAHLWWLARGRRIHLQMALPPPVHLASRTHPLAPQIRGGASSLPAIDILGL